MKIFYKDFPVDIHSISFNFLQVKISMEPYPNHAYYGSNIHNYISSLYVIIGYG